MSPYGSRAPCCPRQDEERQEQEDEECHNLPPSPDEHMTPTLAPQCTKHNLRLTTVDGRRGQIYPATLDSAHYR
jgi:hypothetical protein